MAPAGLVSRWPHSCASGLCYRVPIFPGRGDSQPCLLFSQVSESRACPARRLEKDPSSFPYFRARESLAVKRTNRTCLVACHFNDNTNLSQVSIPHTPPLPPAPGAGGRGHRVGEQGKTEKQVTCLQGTQGSDDKHLRTQGRVEGEKFIKTCPPRR